MTTASANFAAVDLGASSGRLMAGLWNGSRFSLKEVHRFRNGPIRVGEDFYWDVLYLWGEIIAGLAIRSKEYGGTLAGIGVDAWGVDYALLDSRDRMLRNPHSYRDKRTDGLLERVGRIWSRQQLFQRTGVQPMQINTLYQLYSESFQHPDSLEQAESLLMIPDLFLFFLSGEKVSEYTEATTTQMYSLPSRSWAEDLLASLQIPSRLLRAVVNPGTIHQPVRSYLLEEFGITPPVPTVSVAAHDTASAVAAIPDLDEHTAFLSSGTWSLLGVKNAEPILSDEAFRLGFSNEGAADGSVLLLQNLNGLWILQECLRSWAGSGRQMHWNDVHEAASRARPFQAWIDVKAKDFQTPSDMPAVIVAYCQTTHQPVPQSVGEFARCVFESLSFTFRSVLDALQVITGKELRVLRVVGGGSRNHFFCQMIADATGRVVLAGPAEATALGNVLLQAIATGHLSSLAEAQDAIRNSSESEVFEPGTGAQWEEAYHRFTSLMSTPVPVSGS